MRWNRSLCPWAALAAVAALAGSGCYMIAVPGVPGVLPGGGAPPSAAAAPKAGVGFGASAGIFTTMDSEAWNGLSEGVMWNLQASLWLSEIMALQFEYGASVLDDPYSPLGGDMTIAPATVSVVFSVPDPWLESNMYRLRLGVGGGVAKLDHSAYSVPDDIPIFRMQAGGEWLLATGGRLFAVADIMLGKEVDDLGGSGWWWDLSAMSSLRVGLEFGF